jgi:hypothetical protein
MPGDRGQLEAMWLLPFAAAVEDRRSSVSGHGGSIQGLGRPMVPPPPRPPTAFAITRGRCPGP